VVHRSRQDSTGTRVAHSPSCGHGVYNVALLSLQCDHIRLTMGRWDFYRKGLPLCTRSRCSGGVAAPGWARLLWSGMVLDPVNVWALNCRASRHHDDAHTAPGATHVPVKSRVLWRRGMRHTHTHTHTHTHSEMMDRYPVANARESCVGVCCDDLMMDGVEGP
jgi:hypothetical protein